MKGQSYPWKLQFVAQNIKLMEEERENLIISKLAGDSEIRNSSLYRKRLILHSCKLATLIWFMLTLFFCSQLYKSIQNIPLPKHIVEQLRSIQSNQEIYQPPKDKIFCIISAASAPSSSSIKSHFQSLTANSTFEKWKAIYFVDSFGPEDTLYLFENQDKLLLLQSLETKTKNIYHAILSYCQLHSYVFLTDYYEVLNPITLDVLQKTFSSHTENFAMVFPIAVETQERNYTIVPSFQIVKHSESRFKTRSQRQVGLLQNIEQTMRVFQSDLYKIIPHWDLHDLQNQFYKSTLFFQLPIIETGNQQSDNSFVQIGDFMTFPQKLVYYNKPLITTKLAPSIDQEQITILCSKQIWLKFRQIIQHALLETLPIEYKFPLTPLSIVNKTRGKSNASIPRIMHQLWLQEPIPEAKKYFMARNIEQNPTFEHRMWSLKNVTQEQFPLTYSYIMRLLQIEKSAFYSRKSMISDFMRWEIMYKYGGFWVDINYMLFQSLEPFVNYRLFLIAIYSSYNRYELQNGLYGAEKESPNFKRLLDPEELQEINLYETDLARQTGPVRSRKLMELEDEVDPEVLVVPYQLGYPFYLWATDSSFNTNRCLYPVNKQIPADALQNHKIGFQDSKFKILDNCGLLYPRSIGIDFFEYGGSWRYPKFQLAEQSSRDKDAPSSLTTE